jgi:hypothetical protein
MLPECEVVRHFCSSWGRTVLCVRIREERDGACSVVKCRCTMTAPVPLRLPSACGSSSGNRGLQCECGHTLRPSPVVSPASWVVGSLAEFKVLVHFVPCDSPVVSPASLGCRLAEEHRWLYALCVPLCSSLGWMRVGKFLDPCGVRHLLTAADVRRLSGGRQPGRQSDMWREKRSGGRQPGRSLWREDLGEVAKVSKLEPKWRTEQRCPMYVCTYIGVWRKGVKRGI